MKKLILSAVLISSLFSFGGCGYKHGYGYKVGYGYNANHQGYGYKVGYGHNAKHQGYAKSSNIQNYIYSMPKQSLSEQEVKDLLHMREEEKLARDVYLTLSQQWGLPVFRNISKSETWHMQMVKFLLDKYGINDPVTNDAVGVFSDPKLQNLYNELVAKGSNSIIDALKVGATIEDLDIYDLNEAMKISDNNDIDFVYSRLRWGSTNHMRAFVKNLNRYGDTYIPQYISEEEFEAILNRSSKMR